MNPTCSAYTDFGHFTTSILLVTGLALPLIWAHAGVIAPAAAAMSVSGGALIYAVMTGYGYLFGGGQGDDY